jgi:acetate---CoA ligase (ADP-forming)
LNLRKRTTSGDPLMSSVETFKSDVVLKDGSTVTIRPAGAKDRPLLSNFLGSLSEESLVLRFFTGGFDKKGAVEKLLPSSDCFSLIAFRETNIVGQAAYYVEKGNRAEVSVIVADKYQGKGLGTILVGQLAQFANAKGIETFEAMVMPENAKMLDVFKTLGFKAELKAQQGSIGVTFSTSLDPSVIERFERRDAIASESALGNFLKPKSIAVIGASRDPSSIGGELLHNILEAGFNGPVYPVNDKADVVQSVIAYRSVMDCPGPVDVAIIAVPARVVSAVAKECVQKGVKGIVVVSSGFSEIGKEGAELQDELVEICRESGMRLIGPNCMGIANTDPDVRMNAQFSPLNPRHGRTGFLSQSGALGIAVIDHANNLGLGLSSFISVGNKADISGNDLIQYWENDSNTDVILLYLESFGNPRKFARITRRATKKKPIIVVKGGRSAAGFRATQSHTGALLAVSDVTVDALFKQSGVIRVDTIAEMFDAAALLESQPVPKGQNVAIVTNAGGAGILATDTCEALGLNIPELSSATQDILRGFLPPEASVRNPVDMIASASAEQYARAIETVAKDPNIDAMIVIFIPPTEVRPEDVAHSILSTTRSMKRRTPLVTTFMASHGVPSILTEDQTRIPSYPFPETAAKALAYGVEYGKWLQSPEGNIAAFSDVRKGEALTIVAKAMGKGGGWLSAEETRALFDAYKIPQVKILYATSPEQVQAMSLQLGTKVALKGIASGLVHKSDAGAVKLNVEPGEVAKREAIEMKARVSAAGFELTGYLIEPMVSGGVEMIVGVTHDPVFGSVLVCGAGGVMVELLKDISVRVTPVTDRDADEMIRTLKTFPLLNGYRGGAIHDVESLKEVILRVGSLVEDIPEIAELDINPLMVLESGKGSVAVDVRVRVGEASPPLPLGAKR